jgi:gluconokinase
MAEADDFHPRSNIEKMTSGVPLDDEDRMPWLRSMRDWIGEHAADGLDTVVTCSALKRSYRDLLRGADADVLFVHLSGSRELLGGRLSGRSGHFMPPELLDSQFADLQPLADDEPGATLDVADDPERLAELALLELGLEDRPTTD